MGEQLPEKSKQGPRQKSSPASNPDRTQNEIALTLLNPEYGEWLITEKEIVNEEMTKASNTVEDVFVDELHILEETSLSAVNVAIIQCRGLFATRLGAIKREWEMALEETINSMASDKEKTDKISKIHEQFGAQAGKIALVAEYYVKDISKGGKVTEEVIARVQKEGPKLMFILEHDPLMVPALQWALGFIEPNKSMADEEKKYCTILTGRIDRRTFESEAAWVILKQLTQTQLVKFFTEYYTKYNGKMSKKELIDEATKRGVIGVGTIEKLLSDPAFNTQNLSFTDKEKEEFARRFELGNNLEKEIDNMKESLFAKNPANEWLNLKNILLFGVETCGVATTVVNGLVGWWGGGISQVLNNPYVYTGAAVAAAAHVARGEESLSQVLTSDSDEKINAEINSRKSFVKLMEKSAWGLPKGFFRVDQSNGIPLFREFIDEIRKIENIEPDEPLPKGIFTVDRLRVFLETKGNFVLRDLVDDKKLNNEDLYSFALIFENLNIGGGNDASISNFNEQLDLSYDQI